MRRVSLLLFIGAFLLVIASPSSAQIIFKKKKVDQSTEATNTAEPDKVLYDKALDDIKHGRHEVGRLGLQTLINTYPDSEYLAKAKLAIADSYFKEGGSSNITQAIAGYKDFIVFFPFMPEAAYAQMQVAMCNYNEMPKPDRDNTHAKAAEDEFQTFLTKYPKDPLAPEAQQRLREVQEDLAEGQFRIADYYYIKQDRRAAAGRLIPLVRRYPLYSKSDTALWMLADIFEKSERKDIAGNYYAQIVRNYPLSKYVNDSKEKLRAFNMPIPQPDQKAVEWMTAEQNAPRPKETLVHRGQGIFHSGPDVHTAAVSGVPQMEPENDDMSSVDVLNGSGTRTQGTTGTGKSGIVATVGAGDPKPTGATEDVNTAPSSDSSATTPDSSSSTPGAGTSDPNGAPSSSTPSTSGTDAAKTDPNATPAAGSGEPNSPPPNPSDNTSTSGSTPASTDSSTTANSNQKESSSKKKGIKKLIPW